MIRHVRRYRREYVNGKRCIQKYVGPEALGSNPDVVHVECPDKYWDYPEWDKGYWETCKEILDEPLTRANSSTHIRIEQAVAIREAGYSGPVSGGEARSLARFLREIGKENHVKRAWIYKEVTWNRTRRRWTSMGWVPHITPYMAHSLIYCYVFKPLVEGYSLADFMRVVRMYKPGEKGGCRAAIKRAMQAPDFAADVEMLKTLDLLVGAQ